MSTLTIELPDTVVAELESRQVPNDLVQKFLVRSLELWLRAGYEGREKRATSPFQADATIFVEQLLDDNLELFEKLAEY